MKILYRDLLISSRVKFFSTFFGRIEAIINCFRDLLTFTSKPWGESDFEGNFYFHEMMFLQFSTAIYLIIYNVKMHLEN